MNIQTLLTWRGLRIVCVFLISSIAIVIVGSFLIVRMYTQGMIFTDSASLPRAEVGIIPGAAILPNGLLSPVLKDRVDAAIRLFDDKKIEKILISGDNSTVTYNEVNPVRNYLIVNGVPEEDIFLDHAGFDTYSTMYRAREIFRVKSVIIVTQSFHLPRALFIAHQLGVTAVGYSADHGTYLFKNYVREWFANVKAFVDLAIGREPKYAGDAIPISGDGRTSL